MNEENLKSKTTLPVSYLHIVSVVKGIVLKYGYEQSANNAAYSYPMETFFVESAIHAHGEVYEIWFNEISNVVITPLYCCSNEPKSVLVTLILGDGHGINTFSYTLESLNDEEELKSMCAWVLKTLTNN